MGIGNDKLIGGSRDDVLKGGSGDDTIYGDNGNDTMYGGAGNDKFNAGKGIDTIYAGEGDLHKYYLYDGGDTITAGDGKNLFYFYGSFTNGATTIDKLNIDDQLRFRNDCKKWKTVYA